MEAESATVSDEGHAAFRFIDLFAGIGGLRIGFEELGGECLFTSEWNSFSQETYRANFKDSATHVMAGDIRSVREKDVPEHDLLLAGFPCQPFSIAGVSKKNALGQAHGFGCQIQGTLFFDIARILAYHKPQAFLLENVKNLVSHDRGRTFQTITSVLRNELGYQVNFQVINAKGLVPQNRARIFIVGFKESNSFSFENLSVPDPDSGPRLNSILHPEDGSEKEESPFTEGPEGKVSSRYTLSDHLWNYLQGYAAKHRAKGNGFGFGLCGPDDIARTLSARYFKDGSEILIQGKGRNPRRLTPRECSRLMGFDLPGESRFKIPVSDAQAYRQFGNAVVVPVVREVAALMKPWIIG